MPQVYLIGIGLGNPDTLTVRAKRLIEQSDCLIGAKRMLESAANDHAARHSTIKNDEIAAIIASQPENSIVSVLLSGDVGFYSAAKKLTALLSCPVEMVCGISSLQYFCAKIGTSWDDMQVLSVHGREANVAAAVRKSAMAAFWASFGSGVLVKVFFVQKRTRFSIICTMGERMV